MDNLKFVISREYELGNYSKIIELIESDTLQIDDYTIPLIISLFKVDPIRAQEKLKELVTTHGIEKINSILSILSQNNNQTKKLQSSISDISKYSLSHTKPKPNKAQMILQSFFVGVAAANLQGAIFSNANIGAATDSISPVYYKLNQYIKNEKYHEGIGKCYAQMARYNKKGEKPPSKLFAYIVRFYKDMGDEAMALTYSKKYQESVLEETPELKREIDKFLTDVGAKFQDTELNLDLSPDNIFKLSDLTKTPETQKPISQDNLREVVTNLVHDLEKKHHAIGGEIIILHGLQKESTIDTPTNTSNFDLKVNLTHRWYTTKNGNYKIEFGNSQQIKILIALIKSYPNELTFYQVNDILYDEGNRLSKDHYRRLKSDLRINFGEVIFPKGEHSSRNRLKAINFSADARIVICN